MTSEKCLTANFVLACMVSLFAFSSFYLLLAVLPVYVKHVGGTEAHVGLVVGIFSATAVGLRLIIGWSTDRIGRRIFILLGAPVLVLCSFSYSLIHSIWMFLLIRIAHGAGWSSFGTALNTLVADITPPSRRGEAMGYYGMAANVAMALGPAIGFAAMRYAGFTNLFYLATAVAFIGFCCSLFVKDSHLKKSPETLPNVLPPTPQKDVMVVAIKEKEPFWRQLIVDTAIFPSGILVLAATTYGAMVSFLPIYAAQKGMDNPGVFFSVYAITLVLARSVTGKLSDKFGRGAVITPALVLASSALAVLALADSISGLLVAAVLYGLSFAGMQPTLMAFVVDRAAPEKRGAAMGMYAMAMDLGIGGGALVWGLCAHALGYEYMFTLAALVAILTAGIFAVGYRKHSCAHVERARA